MSQSTSDAAAPSKRSSLFDHPLGFWFFFCGGCAERCCYYGMATILVMYMTQILKYPDGAASRINYYFIAACYILPLAGGYVADKILGNYRTIVYFAVPYVIGQAILGFSNLHTTTFLFVSLALLAIGSGMIKPNISTLMGLTYDQFRPGRATLRSDAFAMFYGAINIGSMASMLCVPAIRNHLGYTSHAYAAAFMLPAVLMTLSLLIFAFGKPFYATETIQRRRRTPEERQERMAVLRRMFGIFAVVVFFWAIYYQTTSTWIYFARDYLHLKLHANLLVKVFDYDLSPDQLQLINPVLILVLLPPITMMWHVLAHFGWNLKPTSKMLIGFVLTAVTMAVVAWSAFYGAGRIVAGAPAAIETAEKGAGAIDKLMPRDPAAEKAAQELLDAVRRARAADTGLAAAKRAGNAAAISGSRRAADAAEKNLDSVREGLKKADLEAIAVLCARNESKDLYAYIVEPLTPPGKLERLAEKVRKRLSNLTIRPIRPNKMSEELRIIRDIYNDAWQDNWGFVPLSKAEIDFLADRLTPLMVKDLVLFAELSGEPVAFIATFPDYNQVLKRLDGKIGLFGALKFLYYSRKIRDLRTMLLGVKRGYQKRGIEGLLYLEAFRGARRKGFKRCELSWVLEDNHLMRRAIETLGGRIYKTYQLFEKSISA